MARRNAEVLRGRSVELGPARRGGSRKTTATWTWPNNDSKPILPEGALNYWSHIPDNTISYSSKASRDAAATQWTNKHKQRRALETLHMQLLYPTVFLYDLPAPHMNTQTTKMGEHHLHGNDLERRALDVPHQHQHQHRPHQPHNLQSRAQAHRPKTGHTIRLQPCHAFL